MGNGGYTFIRRAFCWINLIFWLCGCAFLGIGLWLRFSHEGYATLLPDHAALSADSLLIAVGVMSFVVAFFGCCGSWFESRFLLIVYFSLIILIFLSEFLIGAMIFLFRAGVTKTVINELRSGIEKHYNATDKGAFGAPSVATIWDNLQNEFHCCGVTSYEDWFKINAWPRENWVPESCCRKVFNESEIEGSGTGFRQPSANCGKSRDPTIWWDRGCAENVQAWVVQRLHVVGTIGLTIGFFQLFGLIISMLLFCTMKYRQSSDTYKSYSPAMDSQNNQGTSPRHHADSFIDD